MKKITLFVLLAFSIGYSQKKGKPIYNIEDDNLTIYAMDASGESLLKQSGGYSASVIVVQDDKTFIKHYGEIDKGKGNPANNNTLYEIGSVTKTFTGLLIAKAVTEHKLSLNDDVRKYLSGSYTNLEYNNTPITLKDLLCFKPGVFREFPDYRHLLGTMDNTTAFKIRDLEAAYTKEQFFKDLATAKVDTVPGAVYRHTKLGPELEAAILENIYKKSFAAILNDQLLKDAGMKSTVLHLKKSQKAMNGYMPDGTLMPPIVINPWGAAGLIKSTPADMAKYIKYQLDENNSVVAESHKELAPGFAYCWNRFTDADGKTGYWMHGGTFSTQNIVFIYPEYRLGFSFIINQSGPNTFTALDKARRALEDAIKPGKKSAVRTIRAKFPDDADKAIAEYQLYAKDKKYFYTDESELNNFAYSFLSKGDADSALKIFALYVTEFPNSANAYDSRGEAYFAKKDYIQSKQDYQKSLELNPDNDNAKAMLKKIEAMK